MHGKCSLTKVAKVFGLTERRIQQLAQEGIIPKSDNGLYNFDACVARYIEHLKNRFSNKKHPANELHEERMRIMKAKADMEEIKCKLLNREVVYVDQMERQLSNMFTTFRTRMLAIPERTAELAAMCPDPNEVEQHVKALIQQALQELSIPECLKEDRVI